MIVYYDSYCKICTNSSTIWKKFDWRNNLTFDSFRNMKDYPPEMEKSLHVFHNNKWYNGYSAIIQITKMLPLFWALVPFMYFFKFIGLGDLLYIWVAKNRKLVPVNQCEDGESCQINPHSH
ncbi:thiol-disulfide oxidoreductase DCC family protein [Oceanobacillus damuensis]|uniref:thiol-disulfide oxidoreductase DCC family protein n=1 Tax=Oceanobacillus damuensis TaxID=937928 RepID=UPI000831FB0A|nr:DCC1-like thiol-disulfide oxidoreductase family protein [Oceanobacillus damuensis]